MTNIIDLCSPTSAHADNHTGSQIVSEASGDPLIHELLLSERQRILAATNYLEALYARLMSIDSGRPAVSPATIVDNGSVEAGAP